MAFDRDSRDQVMDLHSLASSALQTRAETIKNEQLFVKAKERHLLELMIVNSDATQHPQNYSFRNSTQLSAHLASESNVSPHANSSLEIYSISQRDTWAPLSINQEMVTLLADHFRLGSGFFQILRCFRNRIIGTEEGFAGATKSLYTHGRTEFGWIYKYAERKDVKSGNPWRIRHTGIYHVLDRERAKTIIFIISPSPASYFITHVRDVIKQAQARSLILASPMLIHPMLITSHLSSWQGYLEHHEAMLLRLDMKPACYPLDGSVVTYDTLKEVREVEKKILPVDPLLTALETLIDDIQEANRMFADANTLNESLYMEISTVLSDSRKEVASYRTQSSYLQRRSQSTAQSVLDFLDFSFQKLAQDQNKNTFVMAASAREDSIAIRAITLVTSFYLPFSFVATMFGMNLVAFNDDTRNLVVSHQFWLYFMVSVPLTAVTLACWRFSMQRYRNNSLKEEELRAKGDGRDLEKA